MLNDQPQLNAFALPSKDVFVYTGLLDLLPDDNAMLAAVLAHEIAHVVERHSVENLGVSSTLSLLGLDTSQEADRVTVPQRRYCRFRRIKRHFVRLDYLLPTCHRYSGGVPQLAERRCGH